MKKIFAFFYSIFFSPVKQVRKDLTELKKFRNDLDDSINTTNHFDGIVKFYSATSPWFDSNKITLYIDGFKKADYGQHVMLIKQLTVLKDRIISAGRYPYGHNRTQTGEQVTHSNVYLGNIDGYWTKTVAFWKDQESKDQDIEPISNQAERIIRKSAEPMIQVLDILIRLAEK